MRQPIIAVLFLFSASVLLMGQQCSDKTFTQTQDDITVSGPCNISLLSGDIVTVQETKAYDLKCTATSGNVSAGTVYFTDHVSLTGNGARFCGTVMSKPFNCDPVLTMTATLATTPSDFLTASPILGRTEPRAVLIAPTLGPRCLTGNVLARHAMRQKRVVEVAGGEHRATPPPARIAATVPASLL
jgi:hypothetical protein